MKKGFFILSVISAMLFTLSATADPIPTQSSEVDLTPKETDSNHLTYFFLKIGSSLAVDVSIDYTTEDGTAIAGEDYKNTSGTAVIKAGQTSTVIAVEIIGDNKKEADEKFSLVISNPRGATFPAGVTKIVASKTIIDDDEGGKGRVSLSGRISSAVLVDVDSDVNDPLSRNISNNTFADAQEINNFYTISGFASAIGSRIVGVDGHFATAIDEGDIYKVNLQAKQQIRLQIADYAGTDVFQGDLDLGLFDSNLNLVASSESENEKESIIVPSDGVYYILVFAYSGISKYILSLEGTNISSTARSASGKTIGDFVVNEAIISYRPLKSLKAYKIQSNSNLILSHQQTDRAVLAKFTQPATALFRRSASNKSSHPLAEFLQELQLKNPQSFAKVTTLMRIKELNADPSVQIAEPNYIRQIHKIPNDKFYALQWHYPAMQLPQAWDMTEGNAQVVVAVIDTGVFLAHEDLKGQFVEGYDFIQNRESARDGDGIDANPDDPGDSDNKRESSWHGTHVSGTIAARSNNGIGIAGIAPNAKIMPMRVLGMNGGNDYDVVQAMLYAAGLPNDSGTVPSKKADIINMSLGGPDSSQQFQSIINRVRAQGVIIVASAGNENSSQLLYPASYDGVISVSATGFNGQLAPYSNYGSKIDVTAPGGDTSKDGNNDTYVDGILSTFVDDSTGVRKSAYVFYQGTSMSAPHISGVIALMKSVYPSLTPDEFDRLLISGELTDDIGIKGADTFYGYGALNASKAVKVAFELSNGGTIEVPALIRATPSSLRFLANESSATIVLNNLGDLPASITAVSSSENWLRVIADNVDTTTRLGNYQVNINRNGLADASYSAKITFQLSTGEQVIVPLNMSVGVQQSEGKLGKVYALLFDQAGELVAENELTNHNGIFTYQFNDIPSGNYYIYAGSDVDNDRFICQQGENCGSYPVLNSASVIKITDHDINNLDFVVTILSTLNSITATSLLNNSNSTQSNGIKRMLKRKLSPR